MKVDLIDLKYRYLDEHEQILKSINIRYYHIYFTYKILYPIT